MAASLFHACTVSNLFLSFMQDKVGSRTVEGRRLRRHVLKGAVIVFITAGYSGKKFIFEKVTCDDSTGTLKRSTKHQLHCHPDPALKSKPAVMQLEAVVLALHQTMYVQIFPGRWPGGSHA